MFECHWSGERYGVEIGDFWLGWGLRSGQDETEMTSTVRKSKIEYRNNLSITLLSFVTHFTFSNAK